MKKTILAVALCFMSTGCLIPMNMKSGGAKGTLKNPNVPIVKPLKYNYKSMLHSMKLPKK